MYRGLFLVCFLSLGCLGNQESQKLDPVASSETFAEEFTEINCPPFQSILEWNFANWPLVTAKPDLMDSRYFADCAAPKLDTPQRAAEEFGPHAFGLIQVRVNAIGLEPLKAGKPVPVGTVVIKEKHLQPKDLASLAKLDSPFAVAVMIKREAGYDPEHGDWEYAYQINSPAADRSTTRGKLTTCIGCHQTMKDQDYLYRKYLVKKG